MRFQVPQFINVEDRIFGPFTLKQAIYLAGSAGISFIVWHFVPIRFIAILIILPIVAFGTALAFYKVNGQPFIFVLESAFYYMTRNKLYLWKKQPPKPAERRGGEDNKKNLADLPASVVPRLSQSKLKDLAWSLDINDNASLGARETMRRR